MFHWSSFLQLTMFFPQAPNSNTVLSWIEVKVLSKMKSQTFTQNVKTTCKDDLNSGSVDLFQPTQTLSLCVCACVGGENEVSEMPSFFSSLIPSFIWIPGVPLGVASCSDTQPPWSLLFPLVPDSRPLSLNPHLP